MRALLFIYWFFCYSVMLVTVVVALARSLFFGRYRKLLPADSAAVDWTALNAEKAHFLLVLSFSFIMAGATLAILWPEAAPADPTILRFNSAQSILSFVTISGVCLGLWATPAFALALMPRFRHARRLLGLLAGLAAALWLANAILWSGPWNYYLSLLVFGSYALTIGGISVSGIVISGIGASRRRRQPLADRISPFWQNVSTLASWLTLAYLPAFVFFDLLPPVTKLSTAGFRFFPLFFVSWCLVYLANVLRQMACSLLPLPAAPPPGQPVPSAGACRGLDEACMASHGLSEREREMARQLCAGRSYKEIAAALDLSVATIKTYIIRLYAKLGAASKIDVINKLRGS
ncbi:MAG: hypothetical protein A2087_14685 [Spirochaetes bacterium GWD1_61_31]|nr:MAG: hypothetical protein A2Y37_09355 [Spirochaetes bacterium GWB1_60_80]OHD29179.1 MAG: hypothetical protein A2004_05705 [Spirochaetes bacterium GWC1_61_12]OHD35022.1 MAG: hypothetical protein A2087_14685 [Spirochaetes bacterium GWD1_61_31]OHD44030.1 MAG: hypothetical protein A2Y35_01695 [Spirochaetes bacterium GWE1_60_18]OHD59065.1 MAG: hypothetical protein A2Y32_02415 [Spirochaetes bacterium GWF1_60_12]